MIEKQASGKFSGSMILFFFHYLNRMQSLVSLLLYQYYILLFSLIKKLAIQQERPNQRAIVNGLYNDKNLCLCNTKVFMEHVIYIYTSNFLWNWKIILLSNKGEIG